MPVRATAMTAPPTTRTPRPSPTHREARTATTRRRRRAARRSRRRSARRRPGERDRQREEREQVAAMLEVDPSPAAGDEQQRRAGQRLRQVRRRPAEAGARSLPCARSTTSSAVPAPARTAGQSARGVRTSAATMTLAAGKNTGKTPAPTTSRGRVGHRPHRPIRPQAVHEHDPSHESPTLPPAGQTRDKAASSGSVRRRHSGADEALRAPGTPPRAPARARCRRGSGCAPGRSREPQTSRSGMRPTPPQRRRGSAGEDPAAGRPLGPDGVERGRERLLGALRGGRGRRRRARRRRACR